MTSIFDEYGYMQGKTEATRQTGCDYLLILLDAEMKVQLQKLCPDGIRTPEYNVWETEVYQPMFDKLLVELQQVAVDKEASIFHADNGLTLEALR